MAVIDNGNKLDKLIVIHELGFYLIEPSVPDMFFIFKLFFSEAY